MKGVCQDLRKARDRSGRPGRRQQDRGISHWDGRGWERRPHVSTRENRQGRGSCQDECLPVTAPDRGAPSAAGLAPSPTAEATGHARHSGPHQLPRGRWLSRPHTEHPHSTPGQRRPRSASGTSRLYLLSRARVCFLTVDPASSLPELEPRARAASEHRAGTGTAARPGTARARRPPRGKHAGGQTAGQPAGGVAPTSRGWGTSLRRPPRAL